MFSVVVSGMNKRALLVSVVLVVAGLMVVAIPGACADDWPGQVTIAGFTVNSIRPVNATTARGMLQIPGSGGSEISLSRSSRGEITGSGSINARMSGIEVRGSFKLDNGGLQCRDGVVRTNPKPITGADFTVGNRGELTGKGRMELGAGSISADFRASGASIRVSGSASARVSTDTQLAKYSFDGKLELQGGSGGNVAVVAQGRVERRGKLADQVSSYSVSNIQVNTSNGNGTVNIDGVNVTFDFF